MIKYLLVFVFIYSLNFAQILKTCAVQFERKVISKNKVDSTNGEIMYDGRSTLFIINHPTKQIIRFSDNKMEIFYPIENIAYHSELKSHFNIPFFQSFISVVKEDNGLSELGFILDKTEFMKDTLITLWNPPKNLSKQISKQKLLFVSDRIINSTAFGIKGNIIVNIIYNKYLKVNNFLFPTLIEIEERVNNSKEWILFSKIKINEKVPKFEDLLSYNEKTKKVPLKW